MAELFFPELRSNPAVRGAPRGVLVAWLAAHGAPVRVGERLAEVRAGDSTGWVCALATGTLWHQVRPGEVVSVGSVIGLIE